MDFKNWFDKESGYSLHPFRPAKRKTCCKNLSEDTRTIWLPMPGEKEPIPCPLVYCPVCKRYYAIVQNELYQVENLLQYRVTSTPTQENFN